MEDTAYRALAIVGVGAILPDAPNAPAFWENVKKGRYSISEVAPDRWDPALYYDPDRSAPDKAYSKIGGWVREYEWDPLKWRLAIPPRVVDAMDDAQKWAIACTREALNDYGYPARPLDLDRTAVILGQCHGRRAPLSHQLAHLLSRVRPRVGGIANFAALPEAMQPRHHPRIAPANRQAPARNYRRHHARRIGQLHCRPHRQPVQFPRPQFHHGRGVRLGDGGVPGGDGGIGRERISTWR